MSDDFDILRKLRPDRASDGPASPGIFSREKDELIASITEGQTQSSAEIRRGYPRLAYLDEVAALEYLTRVFGFVERRESRMGQGGA